MKQLKGTPTQTSLNKTLFSGWSVSLMMAISLLYLAISAFLVGFKTDQLFLIGIVNLLYFASGISRKMLISFSAFIVFWIIFDYMKALPNYNYAPVQISSLYNLEKRIFGFHYKGVVITPNEFFAAHNFKFADVLSGLFYLTWVPVPLGLTIYFFFKNRPQAIHLSFTFLLVNLVGFGFYYLLPAAPPCYVQDYGFEFVKNTPGSAAGLARFDHALGIQLFQSMYQKSSNVFAAMPSLHSAYPVVSLFYAYRNRQKVISVFISITMLGIWWAAVYSNHHYLLDVCAGVLCAILGIGFYQLLWKRNISFRNWVGRCVNLIM